MISSHREALHDLANHQAVILANAELVLNWTAPANDSEPGGFKRFLHWLFGPFENRSRVNRRAADIYKTAAALSGPLKILLVENIKFVPMIEPVSLTLFLNSEIGALRAETGDETTIELSHELNLPLIDADQAMLENLFSQLARNARRAMRDNVHPRIIKIATSSQGRTVVVKFTDNGIGISPENVRKILRGETFSTKAPGGGHGFKNIYETLAAVHGRMDIESRAGATEFTFYFNALPKAA